MKKGNLIVVFLSIALPLIVALLYFKPKESINNDKILLLPFFNAIINFSTTIILIAGFISIKNNNKQVHKKLMITALFLSIIFLIIYVVFHFLHSSTKYGGTGIMKYIYYFILISHIVLAITIVPLLLITLNRALNKNFRRHKSIARITLPLWLYVSITGVLVYLMILPYY